MEVTEWVTLFDIANVEFRGWNFVNIGLLFVVVGITMKALEARWNVTFTIPWLANIVFFGSVFWSIGIGGGMYRQYHNIQTQYTSGAFSSVTGKVEKFTPSSKNRHNVESFFVGDKRFSYSDYILTPGFNNMRENGGPIFEGLFVRVGYIDDVIVRLEVDAADNSNIIPNREQLSVQSREKLVSRFSPYIFQLIATIILVFLWWLKSLKLRDEKKRYDAFYNRVLIISSLIGSMPVVAALGIYLWTNGPSFEGNVKVDLYFFFSINLVLAVISSIWVFLKGGGQILSETLKLVRRPLNAHIAVICSFAWCWLLFSTYVIS